jgi:hypothetical protein
MITRFELCAERMIQPWLRLMLLAAPPLSLHLRVRPERRVLGFGAREWKSLFAVMLPEREAICFSTMAARKAAGSAI